MENVSATDAAHRFSELLDAVEWRGATFLIARRGRTVARLGPAAAAKWERAQAALARRSSRSGLAERPGRAAGIPDRRGAVLERLILDTSVRVADRHGAPLDSVIEDDAGVVIAAITAAELLAGVELASSRHRRRRVAFVDAILGLRSRLGA